MTIGGQLLLGAVGARARQAMPRRAPSAKAATASGPSWLSRMRPKWNRAAKSALPSGYTNVGGGRRGPHSAMRATREREMGAATAHHRLVDPGQFSAAGGLPPRNPAFVPPLEGSLPNINIPTQAAALAGPAQHPHGLIPPSPPTTASNPAVSSPPPGGGASGSEANKGFWETAAPAGAQMVGMVGLGAGIGAGSAWLTGGDVKQGAAFGGLMGGVGGAYNQSIRSGFRTGVAAGADMGMLAKGSAAIDGPLHKMQQWGTSTSNGGRAAGMAIGGGLVGGVMFSGHRRKNTGGFNSRRGNYIGG